MTMIGNIEMNTTLSHEVMLCNAKRAIAQRVSSAVRKKEKYESGGYVVELPEINTAYVYHYNRSSRQWSIEVYSMSNQSVQGFQPSVGYTIGDVEWALTDAAASALVEIATQVIVGNEQLEKFVSSEHCDCMMVDWTRAYSEHNDSFIDLLRLCAIVAPDSELAIMWKTVLLQRSLAGMIDENEYLADKRYRELCAVTEKGKHRCFDHKSADAMLRWSDCHHTDFCRIAYATNLASRLLDTIIDAKNIRIVSEIVGNALTGCLQSLSESSLYKGHAHEQIGMLCADFMDISGDENGGTRFFM